jgi:hypothetical protein
MPTAPRSRSNLASCAEVGVGHSAHRAFTQLHLLADRRRIIPKTSVPWRPRRGMAENRYRNWIQGLRRKA